MSTSAYREAAYAPGVWAHQLDSTSPSVPLADIADEITALTRRTGVPMTAYVRTTGTTAWQIVLVRDPSVTHGTPDPRDCERAARNLAATGRWQSRGQLARASALIAIGLREGYTPGNKLHTLAEFKTLHSRHLPVWTGGPAELISARPLPDGGARPYREPGVLTFTDPENLPAFAAIACELGQHRFVVHDWLTGWTVAYSRTGQGAHLASREIQ
ncbi:hypothetical protein ACWEOG_18755 [Amycolatopsis japonica]